jgi:PPOX class probable F420-dependent enzyme
MAQLAERVSVPLMRAMKRPMNAARDDRALRVLDMPVQHGGFAGLAGKYVLLVTYKRDGTAIPAPVWLAREDDRVFVWTEINAFKAKRLRNDPRALLAPCTARGVPLGDPIAAVGRVLTDEREREHAAAVIRRSWGPARRFFERMSRPVTDVHYLELGPAGPR